MSAEAASEMACRTDGDVLARLAAIDHRLNQISTHLAAVGQLLSQLGKIHANLETLLGSLGSAEPIKTGTACWSPDLELPPSPTAAGSRSVSPGGLAEEAPALSALLAQMMELAADRAVLVTGPAFPPMTAPDRPLTPSEALAKLFMDNADRSANAANDELVTALLKRARAIQTLTNPMNHPDPRIEGSPR